MPEKRRPILVTGAHRTGTTWIGRVLAAAPGFSYISEPLNVLHRPGIFRARVSHWYTYICRDNELQYLPAFHELLSHKYHLAAELASIQTARDLMRMGRDLAIFSIGRLRRQTPLLKDPFAVFSLPWFASSLGCRLVVTVRHPAAFASGLKRLGWSFDFEHLLQQPLLMRDHVELYREAMQSDRIVEVVGQAGLLWAMIYRSVERMASEVPGIEVVRHEDFAAEPAARFQRLYDKLGLEFTAAVRRVIEQTSSPQNPTELSASHTHSVRMDSRASLQNWKRRLSPEEVARVRQLTDGVWQHFYPEESWT